MGVDVSDQVVRQPTSGPILAQAPSRWSRRRVAWAGGVGATLSVVAVARGVSAVALDPMWLGLGVVAALMIAAALATYVPQPGTGLRLELGCGPCAVAGLALTSVAAWMLVAGAVDGGKAAMSVVLAGFATAQRLSQPVTCRR